MIRFLSNIPNINLLRPKRDCCINAKPSLVTSAIMRKTNHLEMELGSTPKTAEVEVVDGLRSVGDEAFMPFTEFEVPLATPIVYTTR